MKIKSLVIALLFGFVSKAQTQIHTIQKGETIGAVAKKYGVATNDVLVLNGLTDKTILKIGQIIKIPGKGKVVATPVKETKPKVEEKETPMADKKPIGNNQHLIERGESLGKIARKYNTTEKQLMEWNNLKNDNIRAGDYLIISNGKANNNSKPEPKKVEVEPKAEPIKPEPKKSEVKVEPIKPKPIEPPKEVVVEKPKAVIEPIKEETQKPIEEPEPKVSDNNNASDKGAFEGQYNNNNNSVAGTCGLFKTIAGWHDKKYYILINNIESGSVVKVMANGKFVYAKVLGPLPEMKEAKNFKMRISNATAAALGIQNNEFEAKVEY